MNDSQALRRAVPEWVGKSPDSAIPPRVQARVVEASGACCAACGVSFSGIVRPQIDHIVALINGGENREGNLQALCGPCHQPKTREDVAVKATVARKRGRHLGLHSRPKMPVGGWAAKKFKKMPDGRVVDRATGEEVTRR